MRPVVDWRSVQFGGVIRPELLCSIWYNNNNNNNNNNINNNNKTHTVVKINNSI